MVSTPWLLLALFGSLLSGFRAEDQAPETGLDLQWPNELTDAEDDSLALPRSSCPPDAIEYNRYCYQLNREKLDWNNAEVQCQTFEHGHLASFRTLDEEIFVSSYITIHESDAHLAWTGFHATPITSNKLAWSWSDGSRYISGSKLWDNRQPNTSPCSENCIALSSITHPDHTERWEQHGCAEKYISVCKFKA